MATNSTVRRKPRGRWSPSNLALCFDMAREGSTNADIALAVGMSVASVEQKLIGMDRPRKRVAKPCNYITRAEKAPQSVLDERERRQAAIDQRGLCAALLGDPPRGYSALDQKRAQT